MAHRVVLLARFWPRSGVRSGSSCSAPRLESVYVNMHRLCLKDRLLI